MSLNWRWDDKIGEATVEQTFNGETKTFTKSLYEGNAFLIFITEWKENEEDMYSLYSFFADEAHAKNCLGLTKNHNNIFTEGCDKLTKISINKKKSRNWKKIVTLFAQAFDDIEIKIFSEEDANDKGNT